MVSLRLLVFRQVLVELAAAVDLLGQVQPVELAVRVQPVEQVEQLVPAAVVELLERVQ